MPNRNLLAIAAACTLVSAYGLFAGCTDDTPQVRKTRGPSTSTPEPGSDTQKFEPAGCGYAVGVPFIDGWEPFDAHEDVLGSDPQPRHVRRGLGGDVKHGEKGYADPSTSFTIGWQTEAGTKASKIRFGESESSLDETAEGFSVVVLPGLAGNGPPEGIRFHEAHVCGLQPGRTYYYQVGGGPSGSEVWSPVYSTTTAPAATEEVKLGFVGDSRDALGRSDLPVWKAIAARYKAGGVPLVLFSGDMVFAGVFQDMWDSWSKATGEAGTSTFFALAPGNHENEQIRVFAHMLMPGAFTKNAERYSSFDYGPVHVVMLDDYHGIVDEGADDTSYHGEVLAWLEKDLAAAKANRANVPWIVTFHHHPLYSDTTQTERAGERAQVREAFQALYDKYEVDLDLTGHDHFYERFKPIKADKEEPKGVVYVVNAAAGAPSYSLKDGNPLAAFKATYDPDKGQGYYAVATVSKDAFHVVMRNMASAGAGSSPDDDAILEEFDLVKK